MGIGWLAVKTGYLKDSLADHLNAFTVRLAVPVLLFRAMVNLDFSQAFNIPTLVGFYSGAVISFLAGIILARKILETPPRRRRSPSAFAPFFPIRSFSASRSCCGSTARRHGAGIWHYRPACRLNVCHWHDFHGTGPRRRPALERNRSESGHEIHPGKYPDDWRHSGVLVNLSGARPCPKSSWVLSTCSPHRRCRLP